MSRVVRAVVGVGLAVVGAVTGNFALVVAGLQVAGSALMSPKGKAREASAVTVQVGEVSRQALFGRVAVAGSLADAFNYGGKYGTDWEVLVLPLADHRCDALEGFYVADRYVPFTGDGAVPGFGGQLSVWWRSGAAGQGVPAILTQNGGWTPADTGEGVAYVVVAYKADASDAKNPVWPGGRPRFLWVVRGALCYDPRRDSSVGGSGPQRRESPATWTWSENPIVCRYAWVRGIYAGDRVGDPDQLLIGRGLSALEAPPANVFHRANLCDEIVDGAPRYRIGAIVDAGSTYIDVEQSFAAACAGTIVQPQGSVEIDPGEARGAVVTITDDDLLVGSKAIWNNRKLGVASSEWVNTVVASYVEPALKWADHAAPVRRDVADILTDKRPREERVPLGFVTDGAQAGRIAEVRRRLGRLWGRAEITLPPRFSFLEEGDWIVWHSPRRFGPVAFTFRVEAWGSNAGWHHQLSLRQISASVYSDAAPLDDGSVAVLPPVPPAIGAPAAGGWELTAGYQAAGDIQMPVLIVAGAIDDRDARFVRIEYALAASTVWSDAGVTGPDVRHRDIPVAGGGAYRVAISYVVDGVTGDRLILGPVTAGGPLYADGTPVESLQPAEPGATEGAPIGTNIGGRPVANVLATLDAIEPIAETYGDLVDEVAALSNAKVGTDAALGALNRATGDHAAALAQAERDAGRIGDTLLRLLAESERTRAVLRDAGIVVDSAGVVRIYAVDQLAERTSSAEVRLDAATATITQKASVEYVQEQIALAVLDPTQAAQLEPIIARLTSAEQTISGLGAAVLTKAEAIELTRVAGRVTTVTEDLDALAGTVSTKATRTDVEALDVRVGLAEQTLSTLDGVSSFGVTVRQARAVADDAAEAGLRALLAGDQAHRRQIVQQAEARTEMFAKLVDQSGAEAAARQLLSVQIGALDARSVQESVARIEGDKALSIRIDAQAVASEELAAAITTLRETSIAATKGIAGITTTIRQQAADDDTTAEALLRALIAGDQTGRARAAQLVQVQMEMSTTLIANEQASAVARQSLLVRMQAAEAAIVTTSRALADLTKSVVERITAAEVVIADPVTGLAATRARLTEVDRLSVERDQAIGEDLDQIEAAVGEANASVSRLAKVVTDGDEANAQLIEQVRVKLGDLGEATVQDLIEAAVAETGKILARRTVSIDINGNLVGWSLIGSEEGPGALNLINTDLKMGTGRVVFDNGAFMLVQGIGFGTEGKLIEWYGPAVSSIGQCSISNAIAYKTNDGRAVFRGAVGDARDPLSASTTVTGARSLTTPAWEKIGEIVRVRADFTWSAEGQRDVQQGSDAPQATIVLYRRIGSGAEVEVGRSTAYGSTQWLGTQPDFFNQQVSADVAYADTDASRELRIWRAAVSLTGAIGGSSSTPDTIAQSITITATPQ